MNGLFQPIQQPLLLDPNGTTNGISNAAINAARMRAGQPPQQPPQTPPQGWMSPEEMRAMMQRQSFGGPQMGQPQGQMPPDMSTMYPAQDPQRFQMPMNNGQVPPQEEAPVYIGNPIVDKYINQFIGV